MLASSVQGIGRLRLALLCSLFVLVLAACGGSAQPSEARLAKDTARSAANKYAFQAVMALNNTDVHASTSAPLKTKLMRKNASSYRYWENWSFVEDATGEFLDDCWMYVILEGDSSLVRITLQKNGNPCKGMPKKAMYYPASDTLDISS